jgi:hypothetical protein
MRTIAKWSAWNKFYVAAFVLYSALLCFVSLTVFVSALRQHAALTASDIVIQTLMTLFLPVQLLGIRKPRLASGLLFAGAATDLALTLFLNAHARTNTSGALNASLLFLGFPMLASAIVFHLLSRPASPFIEP